MTCKLCEMFSGKIHSVEWEADGANGWTLHNMNVCSECKEWLDRMFSIRTRYITTFRDLNNY